MMAKWNLYGLWSMGFFFSSRGVESIMYNPSLFPCIFMDKRVLKGSRYTSEAGIPRSSCAFPTAAVHFPIPGTEV